MEEGGEPLREIIILDTEISIKETVHEDPKLYHLL